MNGDKFVEEGSQDAPAAIFVSPDLKEETKLPEASESVSGKEEHTEEVALGGRRRGKLLQEKTNQHPSRFDRLMVLSKEQQKKDKKNGTQPVPKGRDHPSEEESFNFFANDYTEGDSKPLLWESDRKGKGPKRAPRIARSERKSKVEKVRKRKATETSKKSKKEKEEEEETEDEETEEEGETEDEEKEKEEEEEEEEEAEDIDKEESSKGKDEAEIFTAKHFVRKKELPTEVRPPLILSSDHWVEKSAQFLFIPAINTPDRSRDEERKRKCYNLEDEGIFVGEKPTISKVNLNIIENRIRKQGRGQRWLTEDGHVVREDVPLSNPLVRRVAEEDVDEVPPYVYFPACPVDEFGKMDERRMQVTAKQGILCFNIGIIQFASHPLFSREHELASELAAKVETFVERDALRLYDILHERLKVLRSSLHKLEAIDIGSNLRSMGDSTVNQELQVSRRHALYRREIRECREALHREGRLDREILVAILDLWKSLKEERRRNDYQATHLRLVIHKEETKKKKKEELREIEEEIEEEVEERTAEEEEETRKKNEKYKKEMEIWKENHKIRKDAIRRQKKHQNKTSRNFTDDEVVQIAQDQIILGEEEKPKPTPPPEIDKKQIREKVIENFKVSRRPPGEPILRFSLTMASSSTPTSSACPSSEKRRKNLISRTKLWLKMFINKKLMTETPHSKMNEEFVVEICSTFLAAVWSWPNDIKVEIHESLGFEQRLVGCVSLPIPSRSATGATEAPLDKITFSSNKEVESKKKKKGKAPLTYKGSISFKLFWKSDEEGMPILPSGAPPKVERADQFWGEDEHSIGKNLPIDPNDPRNVEWISKAKRVSEGSEKPQVFDLFGKDELFCSEDDLQRSVRLRVLRLRNQEVPEFKGFRMVPSVESQVLKKTLENYERKVRRDSVFPVEKEQSEFEENKRKTQAEALVHSILYKLEEQNSQVKEPPCLKDLVKEEQIPNIGSIGELLTVPKAKRPLKPERGKPGLVRGVGLSDQNVRLIIHITRGFHIPVRQELSPAEDDNDSSVTESKKALWDNVVRPFVEVSFQKVVGRTHAAVGSSPTWNEQLVLPFKPPNNDFTSSNLQTIEDHVFFHLYDEVTHDLLEDERKRETTIFHQLEKRWLGSLKIPFSTIYINNKIEGTFRLECPALMLGYTDDLNIVENEDIYNITTPHLSIYLTLEPTLPFPQPLTEPFESTEPESLIKEGRCFVDCVSVRYPRRRYRSHVPDLFGELVSLNRFIKPLEPPPEVVENHSKSEVHRVAWYVSLLPCLANTNSSGGLPKLWSNVEQFVSLGIGGTDEKAILLTNFLLNLGTKAFLLMGSGIPEGICSYVLLQLESKWHVICPDTASIFDVNHPFSPLKSVYMLISEDNIYANIQTTDSPPHMKFDVRSPSDWKPLYTRSFPSLGLPSIQPDVLSFKPVQKEYWKDLKKRLRVVLRDAFMKWRPMFRTTWNGHLTKILQALIRSYENEKLNGKVPLPNFNDLTTLMNVYKVCGVCIHQGYTTMEAVVEAVFGTGIHTSHIPGIEFALAIEIFPYPGEAASIWVYVASLTKR